MREVNFSIPNVNKASVGITTALYDRRALDCTSTLPLINSLNHLAYLTTSSARIRDILTVDGGVERLVCILKQGRSQNTMEMWKWNLAFQCVVNIGVRGSEDVRTRVVQADMVPVIATILDNYIRVLEKCREKVDADARKSSSQAQSAQNKASRKEHGTHDRGNNASGPPFSRRQPPPAIEIPVGPQRQQRNHQYPQVTDSEAMEITPIAPQFPLTSPTDNPPVTRHHSHHHHHHHHHQRPHGGRHRSHSNRHSVQPIAAAVPSMDASDEFGLRPVREIDRLPSTVPALQTGITSQPESPTTPNAPPGRHPSAGAPSRRRPSLRQRQSVSGDSDDANGEESAVEASGPDGNVDESMIDIQNTVEIQGAEDPDPMVDAVTTPLDLAAPNASEGQQAETFNITHRSAIDGSIINANAALPNPTIALQPPLNTVASQDTAPQTMHSRYQLDRSTPPGILAATPRDEDVLMSLQLLAYVSKYCTLRTYFQRSHLVPKLKIGHHLELLDEDSSSAEDFRPEDSEEEEYILPDDFNIFPLVEKFTVRHHSQEMQHWAGVVMRNLCRKDDDRGGIRQCAYYDCGRWEQFPRQFAKCRRCRRTKYCSKDCQKNAWVYHRHWCQVAVNQ